MNARYRQTGFTLIELMVALLIGLFLAAGLVTMTQNNKTTFTNQNALSQLQDNERFALSVMNDVIQAAGYFPDPVMNTALTDMPVNPNFPLFTQSGQPLAAPAASNPASISVQVALATNDVVQTCAGTQNAGPQSAYVSTFTVVPNVISPLNSQLMCTVTAANGAQTQAQLVSGVTDMEILYGINALGAATTHDVTEYKTAAQMGASDWMNVTSVQVTLLFANPLAGQAGVAAGSTISITKTISVMARTGVTT